MKENENGTYESVTSRAEREKLFALAARVRRDGYLSAREEAEAMDEFIRRVDGLFREREWIPFWNPHYGKPHREPLSSAELFFSLCAEMRFWQKKTALLAEKLGGFRTMEAEARIDGIIAVTREYYISNGRKPFWE